MEFAAEDLELRDMRHFANPDPRPKSRSPALKDGETRETDGPGYTGAFGKDDNWLKEWTFFGPELDYNTRAAEDGEWQPPSRRNEGPGPVRGGRAAAL